MENDGLMSGGTTAPQRRDARLCEGKDNGPSLNKRRVRQYRNSDIERMYLRQCQTNKCLHARRSRKLAMSDTMSSARRQLSGEYVRRSVPKSPDTFVLRKGPFNRLVQELAGNYKDGLRWPLSTVIALQAATEAHMIALLRDAKMMALHARRITVVFHFCF